MYRYCKTIWIWSLKVGNIKCGSFLIWDFSFPQKLIDESCLFWFETSQGGYSVADPGGSGGPDPPPPHPPNLSVENIMF